MEDPHYGWLLWKILISMDDGTRGTPIHGNPRVTVDGSNQGSLYRCPKFPSYWLVDE